MKCSKCEYNHKKKYGFKCSNCGHQFTFDPANGMSDFFFKKLIHKASKESTTYFTTRSFYATYKNIIASKGKSKRLTYGILTLVTLPFFLTPFIIFAVIVGVIFLIKFLQYVFSKGMEYKELIDRIPQWVQNNPDGANYLIDEKLRLNPQHKTSIPEEDIYNYGLEGVVFVDEDQYVDWLIMNGFHFTNRVAVISIGGYPENLQETIQKLVTENPSLPIYFLHNGDKTEKDMVDNISFVSLEDSKYRIDVGLNVQLFSDIEILKKFQTIEPFSKNLPLDTLSYAQVANLFGQFKGNIDDRRKQLDDSDDHDEGIDMIMIGDMDMGMTGATFNMADLDMDLDFG